MLATHRSRELHGEKSAESSVEKSGELRGGVGILVETSTTGVLRNAMLAVYSVLHLNLQVPPVRQQQQDFCTNPDDSHELEEAPRSVTKHLLNEHL